MALLIECADATLTENKILEDVDKKRKYFIEGIFLQSDVKNGNRRLYPEPVMDSAVNAYIQKYLITHRGVGELEHPEEERNQQINYRFVSHKIVDLKKQGKDWWGRAEITTGTPMGALAAGLIESNVVLGTSSRAWGSVKQQNGIAVVQNDFRIITPTDIVYEPSAPDAIVTSIMENKEWVFENGVLIEREINQVQNLVNKSIRTNSYNEVELFNSILNLVSHK